MQSTIAVDVSARPELVFALARNVERWPNLLPHYQRVRILARHADGSVTAEMVARRAVVDFLGLGLPVAWRSRVWTEPSTLGLRFHHLGGATAGMEVTWRIESTSGGCRVSIEHTFQSRSAIPVIGSIVGDDAWPTFVDRLFIRPIATRTLATFRALAEALGGADRLDAGGALAGGDVLDRAVASEQPDPAYQRP